jgi:hypothetical protein
MVGVIVLVFEGVRVSVGMSVSEAVSVGIDVPVGVRDTNAPKFDVPYAMILPSRYPIMVLTWATPMTTASLVLWGNFRTS